MTTERLTTTDTNLSEKEKSIIQFLFQSVAQGSPLEELKRKSLIDIKSKLGVQTDIGVLIAAIEKDIVDVRQPTKDLKLDLVEKLTPQQSNVMATVVNLRDSSPARIAKELKTTSQNQLLQSKNNIIDTLNAACFDQAVVMWMLAQKRKIQKS